jgi:DNA-binding NarL/FixJ family response regulator
MTSPPGHGDGRTIFLIDGWSAFRRSLRLFVEAAGYEVVGEADTAEAAVGVASLATANIVVLDPGRTWRALDDDLTMLRAASPRGAFVLLASEPLEQRVVAQTLHLGICAYLTKIADPADLLNALAVAAAGRFVVLPQHWVLPRRHLEPEPQATLPVLTRREHEILTLAAEGHSNTSIARMLWLAEQSVRFHLTSIFRKLGVSNRVGAIRTAQHYGLIDRWRLWPELPPDVDGDAWPEKP